MQACAGGDPVWCFAGCAELGEDRLDGVGLAAVCGARFEDADVCAEEVGDLGVAGAEEGGFVVGGGEAAACAFVEEDERGEVEVVC